MGDPRVGSVLGGRYRIDARLAAGGTGIVYNATQLGLNRSVAIKFLHQSSAHSSIHQGRFEREARVMSKLSHPNIAGIIDFGSEDDSPYLVMELCKGISLRAAIAQGPLEPRRATHIARQILAGLAHAHDTNIVHRDLKPGNVMLVDSLGEDHLKILDFGVAKIMSTEGPTELSVAASGPLGTPQYMSPEQAKVESVDARTDLYALGIILYEMCTGKRPFDSGVGFALLRQQVEDTARPPRQFCDISEELEAVILRAMQKNPDDRFQTAAEMMDALAEVPEMTGSGGPSRRWARWGVALVCLGGLAAGARYGAQQGLYELPWLWQPESQPAAVLATMPAAPDAGTRQQADAAPTEEAVPAWSPPAATVELAVELTFLDVDNQELAGTVAGERFEPRFAVLEEMGENTWLRFTTQIPESRVCSRLEQADLGAALSMALPARPVEGESMRSGRRSEVTLTTEQVDPVRNAKWKLEFVKLDSTAKTATARIDLRGRKTRLSGEFVAAYCPDPGERQEAALPTINEVLWDPERAPDPELLPAQSVAGAFGDIEFLPAHVHLTHGHSPERTVLSFFAEAPLQPCSGLGANDVGAIVTLPGRELGEGTALSALLQGEETADAGPWVAFQFGSECAELEDECPEPAHVQANILSIRVDSVFPGEIRGRLYAAGADPRHSLLVGAFRAQDCRDVSPGLQQETAPAADASPIADDAQQN